jgi:hypothetical protein
MGILKDRKVLTIVFSIISGILALIFFLLFKNTVYSILRISNIHVMKWQAIQLFSLVIVAILFFIFILAVHSIYLHADRKSKLIPCFLRISALLIFMIFLEYLLISFAIEMVVSTTSVILLVVVGMVALVLFIFLLG